MQYKHFSVEEREKIQEMLWHAARILLASLGILLAFLKKTSIMSVRARKT
ncbi:MAG: hypothetical protein UY68_C0002G0002 [Parcubacteria group bacterium GW2011_GWF2_52_12]|nr:MAG: hypothetical protein UY66_C0004G0034 [Parcubacteria group bacterium GW2011_GWC1_51_35]KKW25947.1 MAG: hypothetical protein UY68_C0002G0002 [Parcubacteria group bacterium GW2011_GWF2_52_12]